MKFVYCHKNNKGELACKTDEEIVGRGQKKGERKGILPSSF